MKVPECVFLKLGTASTLMSQESIISQSSQVSFLLSRKQETTLYAQGQESANITYAELDHHVRNKPSRTQAGGKNNVLYSEIKVEEVIRDFTLHENNHCVHFAIQIPPVLPQKRSMKGRIGSNASSCISTESRIGNPWPTK